MARVLMAFVLGLATLGSPAIAGAQNRGLPDFTELAAKQGPTVVNISTTQRRSARSGLQQIPNIDEDDPMFDFFRRFIPRQPQPRDFQTQSLGSGFIISSDGYILTNAHVVDNADEIRVRLTDKREFKARAIGADRRTDVALLKIDATGLPTVRLGDPNKLKVGEWVAAIGSPFGFESSVTSGIVSAKGRSLPQENFVPFIQTDAAINPGNSGGPLFNMKGEVVGINSQIYSRTGGFMGLSFAIPIDVAMRVQAQLRRYGHVSRGRIGVVIQEVTEDLAESFGLPKPMGALVNSVEKGGPADKAGAEAGDIVLKFDGETVESSSDLPRMVGNTKPGTVSTMEVWRDGARRELRVTLGELSGDKLAAGSPGPSRPPRQIANRLGFTVRDLTNEEKRDVKVDHGVFVGDVRADARATVRAGDVITALTRKGHTTQVNSAAQFGRLLAQADRSAVLTLHIRRGEGNVFVAVKGETGSG